MPSLFAQLREAAPILLRYRPGTTVHLCATHVTPGFHGPEYEWRVRLGLGGQGVSRSYPISDLHLLDLLLRPAEGSARTTAPRASSGSVTVMMDRAANDLHVFSVGGSPSADLLDSEEAYWAAEKAGGLEARATAGAHLLAAMLAVSRRDRMPVWIFRYGSEEEPSQFILVLDGQGNDVRWSGRL